ncbi:MAG: recombinase family protein [Rikenellaceae bacterium]
MNKADVDLENIVINEEFYSFVKSLQRGDCVVIYSLSVFGSILELLTAVVNLEEKGIKIESVSEPWFNDYNSNISFVKGLNDIGRKLVGIRTKKGLGKARAKGQKLGRPFGTTTSSEKVKEAERIRQSSNVTIAKACEMAGCQPRTYYRYIRKERQKA